MDPPRRPAINARRASDSLPLPRQPGRRGKAIATITQARAAISHAHAAQGIPKGDNPARHPAAAEVLKGWRNQAPAPKQADALTGDALARIRETARLPRRGRGSSTETTAMAQARGTVDLAKIGVMAAAGPRRSEAAALTWSDIEFWPDGTARITIRKGKNQPEPAQWPSPRPQPAPCGRFSQMTPTPLPHCSTSPIAPQPTSKSPPISPRHLRQGISCYRRVRVSDADQNVFVLELWPIVEKFLIRTPLGKQAQDEFHRYPHIPACR